MPTSLATWVLNPDNGLPAADPYLSYQTLSCSYVFYFVPIERVTAYEMNTNDSDIEEIDSETAGNSRVPAEPSNGAFRSSGLIHSSEASPATQFRISNPELMRKKLQTALAKRKHKAVTISDDEDHASSSKRSHPR
ncbi:hypothetical protein B0H17DRAFT_1145845 [Mycena rosella]|uniref:Uncharacterized protein n=1 Tax=Mycena rosella TaxID=1033263 RepID=A0AAD7CPZ0_MYCRO|nr:hypothetical protein B0H17DRAFT_1145845 [Mycena rosella]